MSATIIRFPDGGRSEERKMMTASEALLALLRAAYAKNEADYSEALRHLDQLREQGAPLPHAFTTAQSFVEEVEESFCRERR